VGDVGDAAVTAKPRQSSAGFDLRRLGWLNVQNGGVPEQSWQATPATPLLGLLAQAPLPTASARLNLELRRLLISQAPIPQNVDALGFTAQRVMALLRLGDALGAKRLAQKVPVALYSRAFYTVARHANLAAFSIGSTCPLATNAVVFSQDPTWALLFALCAGLQGDDGGAALALEIARKNQFVNSFDLQLTDKAITAATGGGLRSTLVAFPQGLPLTSYRLAAVYAGNQAIAPSLFARTNVSVQGWLVRQPLIDPQVRIEAGLRVAGLGMLTPQEWISLLTIQAANTGGRPLGNDLAGLLARAHKQPTHKLQLESVAKLWTRLWTRDWGEVQRASVYIATAGVTRRIAPNSAYLAQAPDIVRSLVLSGAYAQAHAWWPLLMAGSDAQARALAWPLLELTDFENRIASSSARIEASLEAWNDTAQSAQADRRSKLLLAALQGLGYQSAFKADASWGGAPDKDPPEGAVFDGLRQAAARNARGEVLLWSAYAIGGALQNLRPEALREVMRAMTRVGMNGEARIIAAEALAAAGG
jgi:hypothetical protein